MNHWRRNCLPFLFFLFPSISFLFVNLFSILICRTVSQSHCPCCSSRSHYAKVWKYKTKGPLSFSRALSRASRPQGLKGLSRASRALSASQLNKLFFASKMRLSPAFYFYLKQLNLNKLVGKSFLSIQNLVEKITKLSRGRITSKQSQHSQKCSIITSCIPRIYFNWNLVWLVIDGCG